MIQRLVTSNPSAAYVGRVAAAFNNNGSGVRGDLQAVWTAIFCDLEARTPVTAATGGKLREPTVRIVQLARTVPFSSTNGAWAFYDLTKGVWGMGESPLRAPSVFNFFRPGFVPANSHMADAGLAAPEFGIVTESTIAGYLNFLMSFISKGLKDVVPDYTSLISIVTDDAALVDWLNLHFAAGQLSATTIATVRNALDVYPVTAKSDNAKRLDTLKSAIFMVMASPDYLVQK